MKMSTVLIAAGALYLFGKSRATAPVTQIGPRFLGGFTAADASASASPSVADSLPSTIAQMPMVPRFLGGFDTVDTPLPNGTVLGVPSAANPGTMRLAIDNPDTINPSVMSGEISNRGLMTAVASPAVLAAAAGDTVPPIGGHPANNGVWTNRFTGADGGAPQWTWSLMSDPSVSFVADAGGMRLA